MPRTAVLLAGGLGTRIRHLAPQVPKPMISVAGKPFLEWVIGYWRTQGVTRVAVSLGHLAEVAEAYLATRAPDGIEVIALPEPRPMGTGGAVRFAAARLDAGDTFVTANADSLAVADTVPAWRMLEQDDSIDGVVLGVRVEDAGRYGTLVADGQGWLTGFREKAPGAGLINAGVYFFRRRLLERFADKTPLSMENEVFPELIRTGARLHVLGVDAPFLDIGTPESLERAHAFVIEQLAR